MIPRVFTKAADELDYDTYRKERDAAIRTWMPSTDDLKNLLTLQLEDLRDATPYSQWHKPLNELTAYELHRGGQILDDELWRFCVKRSNLISRELGVRYGWWDEYDENGPLPPAKTVSMSAYVGKTMAHVMADVGFFASVGEARKNGWNRPIEQGLFKVGKNKRVKIVKDTVDIP